jgi:hypothetical protein
MKYESLARVLFVALVLVNVGCGNDRPSPTAPTTTTVATVVANPVPPPVGGMFMKGYVSDTAYRSLARATVEVLDGPQAGLSTTADARGEFSMTGVFDEATRFRATAEGHVASIRTLQPFCAHCNPTGWIYFTLEVPNSAVSIGGDYTLAFVANATCTMLPDDMRSRTFTASIPVTSPAPPPNAFFRVAGAIEGWDAISIGVAGNYVALWLETLVEQIAPNTFLAFAGQAAGVVDTSNGSTIVLPFGGSIEHCVTTAEYGRYEDCSQGRATARRCESNHQLTLTRR